MGKKHKDGPVEELSGRDKVRVSRLVEHMIAIPPSRTDPNGSYTGRPMNKYEVPVQDADDLWKNRAAAHGPRRVRFCHQNLRPAYTGVKTTGGR